MRQTERATWHQALEAARLELKALNDVEGAEFMNEWMCCPGKGTVSFKVEVIADSSGEWCSNALRFSTEEGAREYGQDLWSRWTAVKEWRVMPSTDPVTEGR